MPNQTLGKVVLRPICIVMIFFRSDAHLLNNTKHHFVARHGKLANGKNRDRDLYICVFRRCATKHGGRTLDNELPPPLGCVGRHGPMLSTPAADKREQNAAMQI